MTYHIDGHHIIDENNNAPARYGNFDHNFFRTEKEALKALPRFENDRATLGHHSQVIGLPIWALQQIANDLRNDANLRADAAALYKAHTGRDAKYLPRVAYKGCAPIFTEAHLTKIGAYFTHPDVKADIADYLQGDYDDAESNGNIIAKHFDLGFEGERNSSHFFDSEDWEDEEDLAYRFLTAETPEKVIEALQELLETL